MEKNIDEQMLEFAQDEGLQTAIDKAQSWWLMLEDLSEIASPSELKVIQQLQEILTPTMTDLLDETSKVRMVPEF